MKSIILMLVFLISATSWAKSVVMPNPFLEPLVEARLDSQNDWVSLPVSGEHFYGARRADKPVIVELSPLTTIENVEFKLSTGVINGGPYVSMLNAALVVGDKKYSFPVTASDFVSSYGKNNIDIQFLLKDVCLELGCDFDKGELVYLYIDYKGFREIKPIYEWDHMFGAYYLFRYQR